MLTVCTTQPIAGWASTNLNAAWASVRSPSRIEEAELVDLLKALDQPRARPVAAVVVAGEGVLGRQVALEQPGGGGHARDHAGAVALGDLEELGARLLLEQVVDRLQRRQPGALLEGAHALVAPADLRAERDAVVADLALGPQRVELGEQRVGLDAVHARVVELVEVDVVRAQAPQRGLERAPRVLRRPVVRALGLLVVRAVGVEDVAELGRELVGVAGPAAALEGGAHELLVEALAVGVAGVEEGDAEIERAGDEPVGVLVLAPPVRAERPRPEADRRGLETAVTEAAPPHLGPSLGNLAPR